MSFVKNRLFMGDRTSYPQTNDPYECSEFCSRKNYSLAGLQVGFGCTCGNEVPHSKKVEEHHCNIPCPGDSNLKCGGQLTMNVYEVSSTLSFDLEHKRNNLSFHVDKAIQK